MTQKLTRRQKAIFNQMRNDAQFVLDNEPALRFLCTVLDQCGFYRDPMSTNSQQTAYRAGQRKTGLDIVEALSGVDPDAHLKLLQVAAKTRARNAPTNEEANDED